MFHIFACRCVSSLSAWTSALSRKRRYGLNPDRMSRKLGKVNKAFNPKSLLRPWMHAGHRQETIIKSLSSHDDGERHVNFAMIAAAAAAAEGKPCLQDLTIYHTLEGPWQTSKIVCPPRWRCCKACVQDYKEWLFMLLTMKTYQTLCPRQQARRSKLQSLRLTRIDANHQLHLPKARSSLISI